MCAASAAVAAGVGAFVTMPAERAMSVQERFAIRGLAIVADAIECAWCEEDQNNGCNKAPDGISENKNCSPEDMYVYPEGSIIAKPKIVPFCDALPSKIPRVSESQKITGYQPDKVCWVIRLQCVGDANGQNLKWKDVSTPKGGARTGECGKFNECIFENGGRMEERGGIIVDTTPEYIEKCKKILPRLGL